MSSLSIFPFDTKTADSSMDFKANTLKSGVYYINESNSKPANAPFGYGIIARFKSSVYGFMLGADVVGRKLYVSYGTEGGFKDWVLVK